MAGAVNVAKLAVQIEAQGGDQVIGHIGRISESAEGMNLKFARVGSHIAEATDRLASMETIGIGSISRLGVGVAEFAGYFGPTGLIISGVAAAAGVIVSMFSKSREEAKKTREAFDDEIGKMLDSGDRAGLMKQLRDLYQGTPSKDFADGLKSMQEKMQTLKNTEEERYKMVGVFATATFKPQIDALQKQIDDRTAQIAKLSTTLQKVDSRSSISQLPTVTIDPDKDAADAKKVEEAQEKAHKELLDEEKAFQDAWVAAGQERVAAELKIEADYIAQGQAMFRNALTDHGQDPAQQAGQSAHDTIAFINDQLDHGNLIPKLHKTGFDMSSSIVDGFTAGFSGGGVLGALEAFGGSVLSGLGDMFIQMAGSIIVFGSLMVKLRAALMANPLLGGLVALAVGAALLTLGRSLSSAAAGSSSSASPAYSIAGAGTDTNAAQITNITLGSTGADQASKIKPRQPVGPVVIIGPNDGNAQRQLAQLMKNGRQRGLNYGT